MLCNFAGTAGYVGKTESGCAWSRPKITAAQDSDIARCEPVQQLSALKHELEANQSPIMRTVFSFLFPFGPGWNSGALDSHSCVRNN